MGRSWPAACSFPFGGAARAVVAAVQAQTARPLPSPNMHCKQQTQSVYTQVARALHAKAFAREEGLRCYVCHHAVYFRSRDGT